MAFVLLSRFPVALPGKKFLGLLGFFIFFSGVPLKNAHAQSPGLAGVASLLIPGLGQMINQEYAEGAAHLGLDLFAAKKYEELISHPEYIPTYRRIDETNSEILVNKTTFYADMYSTGLNTLSFYSAYDAYRSARKKSNAGYRTPVPPDSLIDMVSAPFDYKLLIKKTSLIPLALPLVLNLLPTHPDQFIYVPDSSISRDEMARGFFFEHQMVAVGEEALFRGYINNSFSSSLGNNWGLALSSALFGVAHSGTGAQATSAQALLFGGYLGYLQQRNNFSIRQSIAIHFWWNFLTSLNLLKQRDGQAIKIFQYGWTF